MPVVSQRHRFRLLNFMRRFLFVALAAGLLLPTTAIAESYWLVLTNSLEKWFGKIEMASAAQCEEEGKAIQKYWSRGNEDLGKRIRWDCIKGK